VFTEQLPRNRRCSFALSHGRCIATALQATIAKERYNRCLGEHFIVAAAAAALVVVVVVVVVVVGVGGGGGRRVY
jgi:hypothetical protein